MNIEQTAQQFELAAKLIRTGHPWKSSPQAPDTDIYSALRDGFEIRPVLATPPDNRPLHNPDNLTAEQVGVGYRLLCAEDGVPSGKVDTWMFGGWCSAYVVDKKHLHECDKTYRLSLSVPWPEVKPDAQPFQLPPPPPGMQWHRTDGWQESDLPQGMRPLVLNEQEQAGDQWGGSGKVKNWYDVVADDCDRVLPHFNHRRTRRPLTFTHAGKTWTWHRLGDPMPCAGLALVTTLLEDGEIGGTKIRASRYDWNVRDNGDQIIGWRYADEKKNVPFGPDDVRCGDELDLAGKRFAILSVSSVGVEYCSQGIHQLTFEWLERNKIKIRRRDSNEWHLCNKPQ